MRRGLAILAVLAGLVGGALWAAPRLVPEDALERWFTARVTAALGAELQVAGTSRLKLLPRPALELGAWRTTTPLGPLEAEGARVVFDWRRLLGGEAAIVEARIDRPTLVVVAPASPGEIAAMLANVDPGEVRLAARDGRLVVPDGDDVELRRLVVASAGPDRKSVV